VHSISIRKQYPVNEKYVNNSSFVIVLSVNYVILDMFLDFWGILRITGYVDIILRRMVCKIRFFTRKNEGLLCRIIMEEDL